jgi:hypothetical protein
MVCAPPEQNGSIDALNQYFNRMTNVDWGMNMAGSGGLGGGVEDFWDQWMSALNHGFTGTMDKFDTELREKHNGQSGFWVKEYHNGGTVS